MTEIHPMSLHRKRTLISKPLLYDLILMSRHAMSRLKAATHLTDTWHAWLWLSVHCRCPQAIHTPHVLNLE